MNVERFNELADIIAKAGTAEVPEEFDMGDFGFMPNTTVAQCKVDIDNGRQFGPHVCGTNLCVAGFACFRWPEEIPKGTNDPEEAAAVILGINQDERETLFFGGYMADAKQGAAHLRACATAGEVLPWRIQLLEAADAR